MLKGTKNISKHFVTGCIFNPLSVNPAKRPNKLKPNLLTLTQQWKHHNDVWNLFKYNNKGTRKISFVTPWKEAVIRRRSVKKVFFEIS